MKRFRGGLVFEAHRLVYHSTLGFRVIKNKKKIICTQPLDGASGREGEIGNEGGRDREKRTERKRDRENGGGGGKVLRKAPGGHDSELSASIPPVNARLPTSEHKSLCGRVSSQRELTVPHSRGRYRKVCADQYLNSAQWTKHRFGINQTASLQQ